ncbi:MAG TPA: hypothetical protein DEA44_16850, partial [Firmicutes bacterium]|nr:hypothetical protein [Bacillota bacterium]
VVDEAKKWGVNGYCPEVRVRVTIDDQAREFNYPLINGATVIKMEEISQQKVATAQKRAYVKGVAQMTGLGLRLWEKEEPDAPIETNDEAHSVQVCSNRIRRKYAEAVKRVGDEKTVRERIEFDRKAITEKQLQMIFWALSHAAELEHQLVRMK